MKIPVLLILVVVTISLIQYATRKSNQAMENSKDIFWNKEKKANITRKTDISQLNYIIIPVEKLPMEDREIPQIDEWRDTIKDLSTKKILNLTGITNTELKLNYGVGNLNALSEYDNNYTILARSLQKWANSLYDNGFIHDAVQVLEFAISSSTDITKSYHLLGKIYVEQGASHKIENLISKLANIDTSNKDQIMHELIQLRKP